MRRIIFFSKYLTHIVGGAEKSMHEIIKGECSKSTKVELVYFGGVKTLGVKHEMTVNNYNCKSSCINNVILLHKFFYWEYVLNRNRIKKYFSSLDKKSELYTYGIYAPAAITSFRGHSTYFVRDESSLGLYNNYYTGIKKYLKYIYMLLESLAFVVYKHDLNIAINKAEVVCNSKYMARKVNDIYGKESLVRYPFIDESRLQDAYRKVRDGMQDQDKGIVFIGDAEIKGVTLVNNISRIMSEHRFYIFSRLVEKDVVVDNVVYKPWTKNEADVYKYAKLVIVPSVCREAYGRVARESFVLNIPLLVSGVGGLPETVNGKKEFIVNDFTNVEEWCMRIKKILREK